MSEPSLRDLTGTIRHLDASRARRLVKAFQRSVVHDGHGINYDADDQVVAGTWGHLRLGADWSQDASADAIGNYQTHLYLHEMLRLPLSVARELTRHRGHLYLDKLTTITDAVAAELATHDGGGLSLNNLRALSGTAATALGGHGGELSLNRVTHLDEAAALGLAKHANDLSLGGLTVLTPKVAAALSNHRGDLSLDGLAVLTGRAAGHLARHSGKLHLHGLKVLSHEAAEAFGGRIGFLCVKNVQRLTAEQAQAIATHHGELHLSSVDVDDAVAHHLGRHHGSLVIRVAADVPLSRLESLVQHQGPLEIVGMTGLDERQARVLAAQPGPRGIRGLSCLFIDTLASLTPAVAAILATHTAGGLFLTNLKELSEDVARELVKHPILSLDRLARVSDRVAGILATHDGVTLSLRGLVDVSPRSWARLEAIPSIELRRLPPSRPAAAAAVPGVPLRFPELAEFIRQLAMQGEAALEKRAHPTGETT